MKVIKKIGQLAYKVYAKIIQVLLGPAIYKAANQAAQATEKAIVKQNEMVNNAQKQFIEEIKQSHVDWLEQSFLQQEEMTKKHIENSFLQQQSIMAEREEQILIQMNSNYQKQDAITHQVEEQTNQITNFLQKQKEAEENALNYLQKIVSIEEKVVKIEEKEQFIQNKMRLMMQVYDLEQIKTKKILLLNDTLYSYHHGSSGTSLAMHYKLENTGAFVEPMHILDIYNTIKRYPRNIGEFLSEDFFYIWSIENAEFVRKIQLCDEVVVNGEGCLSHFNPNALKLMYLIYIAGVKLNKKVALINTSFYLVDYVNHLTIDQKQDFKEIMTQVLLAASYCSIREQESLQTANALVPNKAVLAFDSLPIYIKECYNNTLFVQEESYIVISGGNYLPSWYIDFLKQAIPILQEKFQTKKVKFLLSDVLIKNQTGDFYWLERIKQEFPELEIEEVLATSTDEWLANIEFAKFVVSGRFHHTIASFMLSTPFAVFKTNTKKVESILTMMEQEYCLLNNESIEIAVKELVQLINNPIETNDVLAKQQKQILSLAEKNYDFLEKV